MDATNLFNFKAQSYGRMEHTERLLKLLLHEKELPHEIRLKINVFAKDFLDDRLLPEAGEFLHNELNLVKHSPQQVRSLVKYVPAVLFRVEYEYNAGGDILPYQYILYNPDRQNDRNAMNYLHILAEEGMRVFPFLKQWNLLKDDQNILKCFATCGDNDFFDSAFVEVLQRLFDTKLIDKFDIQDNNLLSHSCSTTSQKRFEFLANCDPKALKGRRDPHLDEDPIILQIFNKAHCVTDLSYCFKFVLKSGLEHFPHELGLLFHKNKSGSSACELAYSRFNSDCAWKIIEECLNETSTFKLFQRHPNAKNYPFMLAASECACGLDTVYYLLREDPSVFEKYCLHLETLYSKTRNTDIENKYDLKSTIENCAQRSAHDMWDYSSS